jgi:RimJ/RimL family protein N-acetyltransferase
MNIQVQRAEYSNVEALRGLYRQEANCQIIHDSALVRGLADPYIILIEGRVRGYGAVWNRHYEGRVMEFYTLPEVRASALPLFREFLAASGATHIEAQTNMPLMLLMLYDCAINISAENILFEDGFTSHLSCPNTVFRHTAPEDSDAIPGQHSEPNGDWLIEANGAIVATGGFLCHYNPPYGDIYMEVTESARQQGFGSYLVQEIKRVCYEAGKRPAARCNSSNIASRRTLQKAGFLPCGRLLAGEVAKQG